ncbi:MAG: NADH:ubiquinone oxidoreductase subunit NDUFA12 [Rhizobiales bacterium]|nr:NADH:ubiquinone oxidoreductase subunit NDUFA12 [Hyphomicrobiales bacterium]
MGVFRELFAWWTGNTVALRLQTARNGEFVGEDDLGNRYYRQRRGVGPLGKPRRWVIYKDIAEASLVPPEWHGWLHHTVDTPPTEEDVKPRRWEKPHRPNLTGTPQAYRPRGSILGDEAPAEPAAPGYRAWKPE